ncbi:MAG: thioesterase family protein [Rhodobiaceae bacterium]|nr:thioesterase family protein [Rhodobiaceae bacterium]MCC0013557.1 thioesterase family protein [Rhodobiaceae bacterium]MCC0018329.1 thioesterase family protein [Rhodobiaceae bacterium]MCC0060648.1 thioesterase family protein [Rhodobiaceae bacterium]
MKPSLVPGISLTHKFVVTDRKTVPSLYPESDEFCAMPEVFATGFMVGFIEWACIKALMPHLDEGEQTVGTHVNVSHQAATPIGMEVSANVELVEIDGKRLVFSIEAFDERDLISKGTHERFVINRKRFDSGLLEKSSGQPS